MTGVQTCALPIWNRGTSGWQSLVPRFLAANLALNALGAMPYRASNWTTVDERMGRFDVIIGSDLLYEREPSDSLSGFLDDHLEQDGEVLLVDPDRGHRTRFARAMGDLGFALGATRIRAAPGLDERYRGRMLRFAR